MKDKKIDANQLKILTHPSFMGPKLRICKKDIIYNKNRNRIEFNIIFILKNLRL